MKELVHQVGTAIELYWDARSTKHQNNRPKSIIIYESRDCSVVTTEMWQDRRCCSQNCPGVPVSKAKETKVFRSFHRLLRAPSYTLCVLFIALPLELRIFGFRTVLNRLLSSCHNRHDAAGKGLIRTACTVLDEELQSTRNTGDLGVDTLIILKYIYI
jgi:hypothetical protein